MQNSNPRTGIAYGVIDARKALDLWQEIQNDGVNTTLKDAEDDIKDRLRSSFAEFDAEECFKKNDVWDKDDDDDEAHETKNELLIDWLDDCIQYATELRGEDARDIAEEAVDVVDTTTGTFKIDELIDTIMTMLWEDEYFNGGDSGEDCYDYESGGFVYHLSCLGGAPMIWVFSGPYATYGRTCSPCVPGALDCDNFTDEDHGNCVGYCLDPADIEDDEDKPEVLYSVDAEGNMEKLPYTKPTKEDA